MNSSQTILLVEDDPDDIEQREKARIAGANGFIRKNQSVMVLREEIAHILFKFSYHPLRKRKTIE